MFSDYLDRGLIVNPNGVWATDGENALTYLEAAAISHRVALALRRDGLEPGSKAAIYSPNDITALACISGLVRAGVTWIALNPKSDIAELDDLLDHAGCDYMLYHSSFKDGADALIASSTSIRGATGFGGDFADEFERWLVPPGELMPRLPFDLEAITMIMGTGGTTGRSKAVPVTCRQCIAMSLAFNAHMPEPEPPVYLMATPMTHAAGVSAWPVMAEGGTVVVRDGVRADDIFESIERHRVSRVFLPPTAIYALLSDPAVGSVDFSTLRNFIYAAAPMSVDRLEEALQVFGPVMTQTFGQVEAPMICTHMSPREHLEALANSSLRGRLKSCGRPSVVAAVEIMDPDGRLLGPGEQGEIVVRGSLVMSGYYRSPEASAAARRPGGWHGTSDIGYRDEDGFVYIVDRQRDMIITGGFNVYPSDVERVIWAQPEVLDCTVIGLPDEKWGEAVTAVVEVKEGYSVSAEQIIAACKAELGSVKAPKAVLFRKLPRSDNGKVLKRVLRDEYWGDRERLV